MQTVAQQIDEFHVKLGVTPDADGWYETPRDKGALPITDEKYLENIAKNCERPWFEVVTPKRYDHRVFVMCCGGPSLADHLDEIRQKSLDPRYFIVCSNMTGGYLLENGIVPDVHFIIDPQAKKLEDVTFDKTHVDTEYWIGLQCDPAIGDYLSYHGRNVRYFFCASNIGGEKLDEVKVRECLIAKGVKQIMAIGGGTMAGLRAINIAEALGFRKMEFYGFDGSIVGPERCYAYDKIRKEMMVEVKAPDGRTFKSTTLLADQATQFLDWERRLAWIDFTIHGNGFIAAMQQCQRKIDAEHDFQIDTRITPEYLAQQKALHAGGNYGTSGHKAADTVFMVACKLLKKQKRVSILDYGCGQGGLRKALFGAYPMMEGSIDIREYDPSLFGKDEEPLPADIVVCADVLEHVEPQCTQATLNHIKSLTKVVAYFNVCTVPAQKVLDDGRNAHINLRTHDWWYKHIKRRFLISDFRDSERNIIVIGEALPC